MSAIQVVLADSLEHLRTLPENTFHAGVTDPPYGLGDPPDPAEVLQQWAQTGDWVPPRKGKKGGFMGHAWDRFVPGVALWREVYRVLRPGAYLAVFAGTRMMDWMSLGLRFANFDIVDTLMWLHGEGWPKGGDVGKRIDDFLGHKREVVGVSGTICPDLDQGRPCRCGEKNDERALSGRTVHQPATAPSSPEAKAWHDCSTSLKPAWEPILLAQKPWQKTAAQNCIDWGTGALRTGPCRIPTTDSWRSYPAKSAEEGKVYSERAWQQAQGSHAGGRWPTNVIWSHHPECRESCVLGCPVRDLDLEVGSLTGRGNKGTSRARGLGYHGKSEVERDVGEAFNYDEGGGPSRFYYCSKACPSDENEGLYGFKNTHPTVKPTNLMRWICRLLCPPGGTLLDPFAGSGTTGKAAALEGLGALLIERDPVYHQVAKTRVAHAQMQHEDACFGFRGA